MKKFIILLLMAWVAYMGSAQTLESMPFVSEDETKVEAVEGDTLAAEPLVSTYEPLVLPLYTPTTALYSPWNDGFLGYGLHGLSPWSNWGAWRLHEGFNAQVGMNVTAGWGKYAPSSAGLGQNIALAYAKTLSPRWAVAVSAYGSNMDWGSWNRKEVGVAAVVRYKANDWLNLYGYASKNLHEKGNPTPFDYGLSPYYAFSPYSAFGAPYYGMGHPSTRVGATAEFKLGERAFISLSFDYVKYDAPDDITLLMRRPAYRDGSSSSVFERR